MQYYHFPFLNTSPYTETLFIHTQDHFNMLLFSAILLYKGLVSPSSSESPVHSLGTPSPIPDPALPKPCLEHLDVVVMMESSSRIKPADFYIVRGYLVQLAERLQISEGGTHMAILLFSWEAHPWHRLVLISSQTNRPVVYSEKIISKLSSAGPCKTVCINSMLLIRPILEKREAFL